MATLEGGGAAEIKLRSRKNRSKTYENCSSVIKIPLEVLNALYVKDITSSNLHVAILLSQRKLKSWNLQININRCIDFP